MANIRREEKLTCFVENASGFPSFPSVSDPFQAF